MSFNPVPNTQAQKVIFSRKKKKVNYFPLNFNNNTVTQDTSQKHLGVILDSRLTFNDHLNSILSKTN